MTNPAQLHPRHRHRARCSIPRAVPHATDRGERRAVPYRGMSRRVGGYRGQLRARPPPPPPGTAALTQPRAPHGCAWSCRGRMRKTKMRRRRTRSSRVAARWPPPASFTRAAPRQRPAPRGPLGAAGTAGKWSPRRAAEAQPAQPGLPHGFKRAKRVKCSLS